MVADDALYNAEDETFWATVHAWRALAQLKAEAAIQPLIGLLRRIDDDDNDWIGEEFPEVFGMIGVAAIEPLTVYLADRTNPDFARVAARGCLLEIAKRFPEQRERIIGIFVTQLSKNSPTDEINNGFLVAALNRHSRLCNLAVRRVEDGPSLLSTKNTPPEYFPRRKHFFLKRIVFYPTALAIASGNPLECLSALSRPISQCRVMDRQE